MEKHIDKTVQFKKDQLTENVEGLLKETIGLKLPKKHKRIKAKDGSGRFSFNTWKNRVINQGFFKIIREGKIDFEKINKEIDKLTEKEFDEEYKVMADFEKSLDEVGIALDKVNQISIISKNKLKVTILVENL